MSWKETLAARLPLYGHRNWIVVTDSAYPAQSSPGIETIVSGADMEEVLEQVFQSLATSKHVRPIVYTDQELQFLTDAIAPGVSAHRVHLKELLRGQLVNVLPHEEIIGKLDQAGKTFRVLLIKTDMAVPYTSVFLQLDCGYWSAEAEQSLRAAMEASGAPAL
jgi:TorA maturation chaperone TorD